MTTKNNPYQLSPSGASRRGFLRLSLLAATSLVLYSCSMDDTQSNAGGGAKIIVVGAGMAGLAAARQLRANGFEVILLEGRSRPGGRIWTNRSLGTPLDLGASWIHGRLGNPITELKNDLDIETQSTDYESTWIYDFDGRELTNAQYDAVDTGWDDLVAAVEEIGEELDDDVSVGRAVELALAGESLSAFEQRSVDWVVASLETETGVALSELSLFYADEDEEFSGGDVLFPGGYDQIVTALAAGLDIRYEQIVRRISYDANGVSIETDGETFSAERAVITLPLGVLRQAISPVGQGPLGCGECHTLEERGNPGTANVLAVNFSPALPERKQGAIARLNMGVLNKVALQFPRVFWPTQPHFISYLSQTRGQFPEFLNVERFTGEPVLMALTGGPYARLLETMTDEQVADDAMGVLRTIFGSATPEPSGVLVTRWGKDHFTGGSYSHIPLGATSADYDIMAEPVGERLFFAGEATSREYPGTVHGAYLSGTREAERVAEFYG